MTHFRVRTPSRLHFGLLSWGPHAPRPFGGVGLMIDRPGIDISASVATQPQAEGPLADRALRIAGQVADRLSSRGVVPRPLHLVVHHAAPEHVGLGTGTQLALAIARIQLAFAGAEDCAIERLAELTGRGQRSGIGLHGFTRGGLIVDGGRRSPAEIPPLVAHAAFPEAWRALVVLPGHHRGLHGAAEVRAFETLPPIPETTADRLHQLVLQEMLPAIVDRDLARFGEALDSLQREVGRSFAPAQSGCVFASPDLEALAGLLRATGLHGVGQSSWGPTLYGFCAAEPAAQAQIRRRILDDCRLDPDEVFWADTSPAGAICG